MIRKANINDDQISDMKIAINYVISKMTVIDE